MISQEEHKNLLRSDPRKIQKKQLIDEKPLQYQKELIGIVFQIYLLQYLKLEELLRARVSQLDS